MVIRDLTGASLTWTVPAGSRPESLCATLLARILQNDEHIVGIWRHKSQKRVHVSPVLFCLDRLTRSSSDVGGRTDLE